MKVVYIAHFKNAQCELVDITHGIFKAKNKACNVTE